MLRDDEYAADTMTVPTAVGYWSALLATILGVAYLAVIASLVVTARFTLPPPEPVQLFAALVTILSGPLLVASLAAVHHVVPAGRRLLSLLGVVFSSAFMVMVSINRFVQLTVIRPSVLLGETAGLDRFMPYAPRSAMLSLEMVGWGFFLGLALLSTAFALSPKGRAGVVRWCFLAYGVMGIASTVAFAADSPLSVIGFVAWGVVLPIGMAFLAAWFGRLRKEAARNR